MSVFIVKVVDANNVSIPEAYVRLDDVVHSVDPDGKWRVRSLELGQKHIMTVQAPSYVKETINFDGEIAQAQWDNALLWRATVQDSVMLTVHLGRLEVAQTLRLTQEEVDVASKKRQDLGGALLWDFPRLPQGKTWNAYRFHTLAAEQAEFVDTTLLPEPGPSPGSTGWGRLNSHSASLPVDPALKGRIFQLLHRGARGGKAENQKTYCISVWSPDIDQNTPVSALDMIVYFSPSTAFKGLLYAKYPFGTYHPDDGAPSGQPYMYFSRAYLLEEYCLIYQLLAQRKDNKDRKAVIIMPLNHKGDWGPYASGEGIFRLCREVALFLHRECRDSNRGLKGQFESPNRVPDKDWYAGGSLRDQSFGIYASDLGLPPKPGRVVLSGFSSGFQIVQTIMKTWALPIPPKKPKKPQEASRFSQRHWGCLQELNAESPREMWKQAWRELWDLDGEHNSVTSSWDSYMEMLNDWAFPKDSENPRMIRLLHTFRYYQNPNLYPPNPFTSTHKVWAELLKEGAPRKHSRLREIQGDRWTVIALKDSYFVCEGGVIPFGTTIHRDAHHAVGQIAFTHFLALSPVGLST